MPNVSVVREPVSSFSKPCSISSTDSWVFDIVACSESLPMKPELSILSSNSLADGLLLLISSSSTLESSGSRRAGFLAVTVTPALASSASKVPCSACFFSASSLANWVNTSSLRLSTKDSAMSITSLTVNSVPL